MENHIRELTRTDNSKQLVLRVVGIDLTLQASSAPLANLLPHFQTRRLRCCPWLRLSTADRKDDPATTAEHPGQ